MKKIFYLLATIFVFNITSCKNPKAIVNSTEAKTIILKDVSNEIKLSDLISDIKYIPLETKTNSLIGEINSIKVYNDNFFIISEIGTQSDIKVFSTDGKFVKKFGNYGEGAKEILRPADIIMVNDLFFVLDHTGIHSFSKDGTYLKRMFNRFPGRKFQFSDNYFYILHGLNPPGLISKIDVKGNLKYTLFPVNVWMGATDLDKIIPVEDGFHIFTPFLDTIFKLYDNKLFPVYYLKAKGVKTIGEIIHENKDLNPYEWAKQINSKANVRIIHYNENNNYLYLNYMFNRHKVNYVLNKKTNKYLYFSGYINDNDKGSFSAPLIITESNFLIIPLYSYNLVEYYKSNISRLKNNHYPLWSIVKDMNIDDNPILMICKLEL